MLGGCNMTWAKDLIKKIPTFTRKQIKYILIGIGVLILVTFRDCNIKTKWFEFKSNSKVEVKR